MTQFCLWKLFSIERLTSGKHACAEPLAYFPAHEWGREEFFLSNHSGSEVLNEASAQLKAAEGAASLADLSNGLSTTWAEEDTRNAGLPSSPRLIYEIQFCQNQDANPQWPHPYAKHWARHLQSQRPRTSGKESKEESSVTKFVTISMHSHCFHLGPFKLTYYLKSNTGAGDVVRDTFSSISSSIKI